MQLNEIIKLFDAKPSGHNQWSAHCPCHNDKTASLSIGIGRKNNALITCHANCKTDDILHAVGIQYKDLYFDEPLPTVKPTYKPKQNNATVDKNNTFDFNNVIAIYEYSNGNRKLRDENKKFMWQHIDNGIWKCGKNGKHNLYFNGKKSNTLYIVEGEKDCNTIANLNLFGASAENGAGGNGKWLKEYTDEIKQIDLDKIRIIPDNDKTGVSFCNQILKALQPITNDIKIINLKDIWSDMPTHADITDMVEKFGKEKAIEMLSSLENKTVEINLKTIAKAINGTIVEQAQNTAQNYLTIFRQDPYFSNVRFNVMRGYPEKHINGKRELWTDTDDAKARNYIETKYHIANKLKYEDSFAEFTQERCYHPIQDIINGITWDKQPRCEMFLTKWMQCEDTPYTRECSRLIFSGGINRAYRSGCKFDEVIVLISGQGSGKSTLCQWLALDNDFYTSTKTIYGKTGIESIQAKWIVEIEELLAVISNDKQGTKTEENAKAFLSTCSDFYRKPYERRPTDNPRNCIFIGTTNRTTFLTDKTGNRRWFPVRCNGNGHNLYKHKAECQEYIRQCWAEMKYYFDNADAMADPVAKECLLKEIRAEQSRAEVEDYREGIIAKYIENKDKTCIIDIWENALYPDGTYQRPTRADANDIAEILTNRLGWVKGKTSRFEKYGSQNTFYRYESLERDNSIDF